MILPGLRDRQEAIMAEARIVTCPTCGFQSEDRGILDWPIFQGDEASFVSDCRYLDEAPGPPAQAFYCISLRTAAKRAAMQAEIGTSRV